MQTFGIITMSAVAVSNNVFCCWKDQMLYYLFIFLQRYCSALNVVHYVSFRAMAAMLTTLVLAFIGGKWFIRKSGVKFRSKVREWTPESHRYKNNMPTMGGVFILGIVAFSAFLWCNLGSPKVWIFLLCLAGFGLIGFWDDWCKINRGTGISAGRKFGSQFLVAGLVVVLWFYFCGVSTTISFPFFKNANFDIGWWFIPWTIFIIVGCSNAVNLTDGLDGLAIGSLMPNFATFAIIAYLAGHTYIASYLYIPFAGTSEIAIIGSILVGVSLGFLWYNTYPAQIFMGDVGSLALGAGLGLMALMTKQELLLPITGGLFVLETVSVIIQVVSFKLLGRRLFKMAPIHHHFELMGWQEAKITVRFVIISLILCQIALMTLKMR